MTHRQELPPQAAAQATSLEWKRERPAARRLAPWLGLAVVLASFLFYLARLRLADNFGRYHDDTLYFSSAQALAQGRGYIIPSLPGPQGSPPAQTKYPVLYPWLLSWIWKWQPAFPGNVSIAVWMTSVFACWFLITAFLLLRRLGLKDGTALALTGLCAFQPHFVFLSGSVLSDMPFMALALTAALGADRALESHRWARWALAAGALAGLAVMMRAVGVAVIAGIAAFALHRRAYRRAVVFCAAAAPFMLAGALAAAGHAQQPPATGPPGWVQSWLFYTGYLGYFRLSVPDWSVYRVMLAASCNDLFETPAMYCLFPPGDSQLGMVLGATLTVGILAGVARLARRAGGAYAWKPIHLIVPFYAAMLLAWSQPQTDRFLVLFLPLFYAGLWSEGRYLIFALLASFRRARPFGERLLAGFLAAGFAAVAGAAANQYVWGFRPQLGQQARERATLQLEKQQAYDWIRRHTSPGVRFVAYDDVSLYLFTGRQAMRPIVFTAGAFYPQDKRLLDQELAHITDVAEHIGARYWVMADDDFAGIASHERVAETMAQWKAALPMVFESRGSRVQLYDFACLAARDKSGRAPICAR